MEKRHSPEYWRDRADEMRLIAETFDNVDTKRVLLDIAADFDELAMLPAADISKAIGAWDGNRRSDAISILLSAPFTHARPRRAEGNAMADKEGTLQLQPSGLWAVRRPGREPDEITSGELFHVEFLGEMRLTRMEFRHSPRRGYYTVDGYPLRDGLRAAIGEPG